MKATLTVLGSGTSMGVPTLGCDCAVCHSSDPHDRRTRPSIMLEYDGKVVLIDTTPDFYTQAVRENITRVDAVLYTHTHADHILGIDDLRPFSYRHKPGSCRFTRGPMRRRFCAGCLATFLTGTTSLAGCRNWNCARLTARWMCWECASIRSILIHGETQIYGYRFGSAAYFTDHSEIPESSLHQWKGWTFCFWMRCGTSRIPRTRR
jgi:phosphoribosyl 1,2-cyclic phosphate phosphodiesterase